MLASRFSTAASAAHAATGVHAFSFPSVPESHQRHGGVVSSSRGPVLPIRSQRLHSIVDHKLQRLVSCSAAAAQPSGPDGMASQTPIGQLVRLVTALFGFLQQVLTKARDAFFATFPQAKDISAQVSSV